MGPAVPYYCECDAVDFVQLFSFFSDVMGTEYDHVPFLLTATVVFSLFLVRILLTLEYTELRSRL